MIKRLFYAVNFDRKTVLLIRKKQDALRGLAERGGMKGIKPHITLARNIPTDSARLGKLKGETVRMPPIRVESAELMESLNEGGRPVYRPLHSVRLTGRAL